jgi:hypothetical protein
MINLGGYRQQPGNENSADPRDRVKQLEAMLENQRRATEDALHELYEERERRQAVARQLHNMRGIVQPLLSAIDFCFPVGSEPDPVVIPDDTEWPVVLEAWMVRYAREAVRGATRAKETGFL